MSSQIDKSWLDQLPPFVSIARVAQLFDQTPLTVRRWAKEDRYPLQSIKMDNGRHVCPRDYVILMAQALYGEVENGNADTVHVLDQDGRSSGDGVDRPGILRSAP